MHLHDDLGPNWHCSAYMFESIPLQAHQSSFFIHTQLFHFNTSKGSFYYRAIIQFECIRSKSASCIHENASLTSGFLILNHCIVSKPILKTCFVEFA